jgi:iron complex outermembrane receptor protein
MSQECQLTFKGTIRDFHDNTALENALIYLKSENRSFTSDTNGKFEINNLCAGEIELVISHIACQTKTITLKLSGNLEKNIFMEHHIEELGEVAVFGEGSRKETETAQETVLKSEVLSRYSALSLGDALKEVPGVSSINTGSAIVKPMINGLYGSRILILTNDVRLQDQEWGVEHAPNIDINSADQISVIKGSGALAYGGDAIGGVVTVKPQRFIASDTLFGYGILGGQTNGWGYNSTSTVNKSYASGWYASVQGSLRQNGDFRAPDYNLTNTGVKSESFSIRGGKNTFESGFEVYYSYLSNEIGILRSAHIGSVNGLIDAINSGQPSVIREFSYDINNPRQKVTHHLLKGTYYKRLRNFGKIDVQYDYQHNRRKEFDIRRGELNNIPSLDLELQTHTLLTDFTLDSNTDRKVKFGFMGRYQDNFAPNTGVRRLIPDYEKFDFGAYITGELQLNERLLLDAGLRYDFNRIDAQKFYRKTRWVERGYDIDFPEFVVNDEDFGSLLLSNPIFNFHNASASVGFRFNINSTNYFIGNYSLSSRPPTPAELFSDELHHSAARIELGDLRLQPKLSNRFSLTYGYQKSNLDITVDAFFNRINDYIYLRPTGVLQSIRGAFPVWEYEQTNAHLFGIDLTLRYDATDHIEWLNKSSLIKGYDTSADLPLIDMPPFSTNNTINYKFNNKNNLIVGLSNEWVFEQNEFPDFNFEVDNPTTGETVLLDVSTPPPAYTLFHLYSEASFKLSRKTTLITALGVNNIFNTSYRNYLNRLRFFADELGRNITIQFRINF